MGERERESLYSTEAVLGRLVEKDKLYQEYRKAMEETGDTVEPMRYVDENGRTVAADTSPEAVQGRRKEYEKILEGPREEKVREKVSLLTLAREEGKAPLRRSGREKDREKPLTLSRDRGMGR